MLFDSLDKLKRNSILSSILLVFLGAVIIICPQSYIPVLTLAFGYILVIISIILILNFLSSKKSLMDYIKFTGSMILGIVGLAVLLYRNDVMRVLPSPREMLQGQVRKPQSRIFQNNDAAKGESNRSNYNR